MSSTDLLGRFDHYGPTSRFVGEMLARCISEIVHAATFEERLAARDAASTLLGYVRDERAITDVLNLLRWAIDVEDVMTLQLANYLPCPRAYRETKFRALLRLAEYGFRRGKPLALRVVLEAAFTLRRHMEDAPAVPKEWLLAAVHWPAESELVPLLVELMGQQDADLVWLREILKERPTLRGFTIDDDGHIAWESVGAESDETRS